MWFSKFSLFMHDQRVSLQCIQAHPTIYSGCSCSWSTPISFDSVSFDHIRQLFVVDVHTSAERPQVSIIWFRHIATRKRKQLLGASLFFQSAKHQNAKIYYQGITNIVVEVCWLRNLLQELHCLLPQDMLSILIMSAQFISSLLDSASMQQRCLYGYPFCSKKGFVV